MAYNNSCEIVEWQASNPQLIERVKSPNANIDDIRLIEMAKEQVVKENTGRKANGCDSGCKCIQVGNPEHIWSGDVYKKTVITGVAADGIEWKAELLFRLYMTKVRLPGECKPIGRTNLC